MATPNQSESSHVVTLDGSIFRSFFDHFRQRELDTLEEQASRDRERINRNYEDMNRLVNMFLMNGATAPATSPSTLAHSSPPRALENVERPNSVSPPNIVNLNEFSMGDDKPFQPAKTSGGAMQILNVNCSEESCSWRGTKGSLADHMKQVHDMQPYRCVQLNCDRSYSSS